MIVYHYILYSHLKLIFYPLTLSDGLKARECPGLSASAAVTLPSSIIDTLLQILLQGRLNTDWVS